MMKNKIGLLVAVILLIAGVIVFYLMQEESSPEIKMEQPVTVAPATDLPVVPAVPSPIQKVEEPPLPKLVDSDPIMRDSLSNLFGADIFKKYFRSADIVRNIVVTIDNLPRKTAAIRLFPVKPVHGKFLVEGGEQTVSGQSEEGNLVISTKNVARYRPYVRIAEMLDAKVLVAIYSRFSPLFQQAYQELGYPHGSFNERLITVIDHLLSAPEIKGPVQLVQPNVVYQFADPALEAQSAGRKILMRMGRENEVKVKSKLKEVRRELAAHFSNQLSQEKVMKK